MMDDLISRKAAMKAVEEYVRLRGMPPPEYATNVIKRLPSVPAVPLDKLCDVLSSRSLDIFTAEHCCLMSEEFWKSKIIEWMEELDDK